MFNEFIIAVLRDIHLFLEKELDFFELDEATKQTRLEASNLAMAPAFKAYLLESSFDAFQQDLKLLLRFLKKEKGLKLQGNPLFKAILRFLVGPFSKKADSLSSDFIFFSESEKKMVLDKLIAGHSAPAQALKKVLMTYAYPQYAKAIQALSIRVADAPYIVFQSPKDADVELKQVVREQVAQENPFAYPVFQVQRNLIGGFRLFNNGESVDRSWLNRVLSIRSLTL